MGLKLQVFAVGFNGPYLAPTNIYFFFFFETGIKFHSMIDKESSYKASKAGGGESSNQITSSTASFALRAQPCATKFALLFIQ